MFLDSTFLIQNLVEMLTSNIIGIIDRNSNSLEFLIQTDIMLTLIQRYAVNASIDEYAMMVNF